MRMLLTGGTGLIGCRLVADRRRRGDDLVVVTRDAGRAARRLSACGEAPGAGTAASGGGGGGGALEIVEGDPARAGPWQRQVDGCDAVVNLAGAGVADHRWTRAYKKIVSDSRVESTRCVVEAMTAAAARPAVLVNASAVGYYGERGDVPLDETAPAGDDFLARLSVRWEAEAGRAAEAGARVVMLRTGVVLDPRGGALARMLPIFRLALGGPLGSGRQHLPWIHWRDVMGLIDLAIGDDELTGPLNVVAPHAVTNKRFTRALGRALHRPAVLPVPAPALRLVMGEFGGYATVSQRVVPEKAVRHGYEFAFPEIDAALADLVRS